MGIDDIGPLEGDAQESGGGAVSEQAAERVREDMRKAAQIRGQIVQAAQHNRQYAQLLAILLQYVDDDILLGNVFQQLIAYKIEATGIFAQFIPFLQGKADLSPYRVMFESIWDQAIAVDHTPESLIEYMNLLRKGSEEIRKVPLEEYRGMVGRMMVIGSRATGEENELTKLENMIN